MKKIIITLTFIMFMFLLKSQETSDNLEFKLGYTGHANNANTDFYYKYQYGSDFRADWLNGVNFEVSKPTKFNKINIVVGALYEYYEDHSNTWSSNINYDIRINGGGIYFGIEPRVGNKMLGFKSSFNLGYFNYKSVKIVDYTFENVYNIDSFNGLGVHTSLGLYFKFRNIGITPALSFIYAGNKTDNFLFKGFNIPISLYFK